MRCPHCRHVVEDTGRADVALLIHQLIRHRRTA